MSYDPYNSHLLQTVVKAAFVAKTMASLSEYDDTFDGRELFERGIDLSQDTCISANTWRIGGAAQMQRVSAWRRSRSLHVQRDLEPGKVHLVVCPSGDVAVVAGETAVVATPGELDAVGVGVLVEPGPQAVENNEKYPVSSFVKDDTGS